MFFLNNNNGNLNVLPFLFLSLDDAETACRRVCCMHASSRRVVADAVLALGCAPDAAAAAVLLVGEGVDTLALAAGLRVLARLVAVAAVLEAVLGVDACALAARRAGAPGREADGWRFLAAVVERRRRQREFDVGKEATSPEGRRRRHHRLLKGDEGEGERHEKDGGFSHGGQVGEGGTLAARLHRTCCNVSIYDVCACASAGAYYGSIGGGGIESMQGNEMGVC